MINTINTITVCVNNHCYKLRDNCSHTTSSMTLTAEPSKALIYYNFDVICRSKITRSFLKIFPVGDFGIFSIKVTRRNLLYGATCRKK